MKIVIAGVGEAGTELIRRLANDGCDITVIDSDPEQLEWVTDKFNVNGVNGSAASRQTLLSAGVDSADIFVALTPWDETNLLSCMQAKSAGALRTAARLQLSDLAAETDAIKKEYDIDCIVCPRVDLAEEIYRNIGLPGYIKHEGLFGNEVMIIDLSVLRGSPLAGMKLSAVRSEICKDMLVGTVTRDGKITIPDGSFVLQVGDGLTITASAETLEETLQSLGVYRAKTDRIVMVGCGISGEYLAKRLVDEGRQLTILESSLERCRMLMEKFPTVHVAYSEGEITSVLDEEHIDKAGALISLTDSDETNLVISMYAWSKQIPSVITRVDRLSHVRLLHKVNIDITASPTELTIRKLLHFIRNGGNTASQDGMCYFVADGRAEVTEFTVKPDTQLVGVPLSDKTFRLKKGVIISGIIRDGKLKIPGGSSRLEAGDRVVVTSAAERRIRTLEDIFA
ncbi:MAG: Trk system potassium transporter TrkA [Lachnospiraceae bacterium]|nr:Trk system potassium transporter TrkA [Lachnospiraceae bacterium]